MTEIVFGTYRLKHEVLEIAAEQAINLMISHGIAQPLLDTAVSYHNTSIIQKLISKYPNVRVGTKLRKAKTLKDELDMEKLSYGSNLFRILIHKHMPIESYLILVQAKADGVVKEIGVSNYTAQQLTQLVQELSEHRDMLPISLQDAIPDICQNEFHPFLNTNVPSACDGLGIRFEAHSVHTLIDHYPEYSTLDSDDDSIHPTVGQLAMSYALKRGGGSVAINTADYNHMKENLSVPEIKDAVLDKLGDTLFAKAQIAKYPGSDTTFFPSTLSDGSSYLALANGTGFNELPHDHIRDVIAPKLRSDVKALLGKKFGDISNTANGISKLKMKDSQSVSRYIVLAEVLFHDEITNKTKVFFTDPKKQKMSLLDRTNGLLSKIRKKLLEEKEAQKKALQPRTCKARAIEDPEALPVEIPDPKIIQPFINLVANATELPQSAIKLNRGVIFPDGRLDFCKQVAQPSFSQLCDAVLKSGIIKHFLIGNNLGLANDTTGKSKEALVRLITESKGIQTFYLAGNAIDEISIEPIANAFSQNKDVRYVWLKMNPIKSGSYHLGRMLRTNSNIEVLDLFNTGQEDTGVQALLNGYLSQSTSLPSGLKHLYLDINAITSGKLIASLALQFPHLESLFFNVNKLGDEGVTDFCEVMLKHEGQLPPLKRLVLGSNGCTDAVLPKLTELVQILPLQILQLGSYRSTKFFQMSSNRFTSSDLLIKLAATVADNCSSNEQGFIGLQNAFKGDNMNQLLDAIGDLGLVTHVQQSNKGIYQYKGAHHQSMETVTSRQLNDLLSTPLELQPEPVKHIQSVYRNAM
ncbi:hypothetical protein CTEN210_10115 [Chaetoceros tenuissimus]|uniref:NADP-dependent oxidoreductase domain-containing protein n=1 Tax=Chaetoceros tenuissimus TaxID=426638 RepID=A0AAD3CZX4_9STRA|nr:hypothetical protein CTEN210_10115 [Chaetoceros tenuissimus]